VEPAVSRCRRSASWRVGRALGVLAFVLIGLAYFYLRTH
jgi:hypothetical protein